MKNLDLAGRKLGRLTVIAIEKIVKSHVYYSVRCSCGKVSSKRGDHILRAVTSICKCSRVYGSGYFKGYTRHGKSKTYIYRIWASMLDRCLNPRTKAYKNYGGRGITVCERWLNFENFYADMGDRPSSKHSLEREDNNGNYEPSNCKWKLPEDQSRNKRNNVFLSFDNKTQILSDWAKELGTSVQTLHHRINILKWSIEKTLSTAVRAPKIPPLNSKNQYMFEFMACE